MRSVARLVCSDSIQGVGRCWPANLGRLAGSNMGNAVTRAGMRHRPCSHNEGNRVQTISAHAPFDRHCRHPDNGRDVSAGRQRLRMLGSAHWESTLAFRPFLWRL